MLNDRHVTVLGNLSILDGMEEPREGVGSVKAWHIVSNQLLQSLVEQELFTGNNISS